MFDAIEAARIIGKRKYLYPGEYALPELELSYIIAGLKSPSYTGVPEARLRRHLLLEWLRGNYKTSTLNWFFKTVVNAIEITTHEVRSPAVPTFLNITGDMSRERLRGSASGDSLVLPLIQEPDFFIVGELMDFLGGDPVRQGELVSFMCRILEEGIGRVSFVKMSNLELSDEQKAVLRQRKITFNASNGVMSYNIPGTFIGATRPLDPATIWKLDISGFSDRIHTVRWKPSMMVGREQWKFKPQSDKLIDTDGLLTQLQGFNRKVWASKVENVNEPPAEMVDEIKSALDDLYCKIEYEQRLTPDKGLRSMRDTINIMMALTGYSYMEMIAGIPNSTTFSEIQYTPGAMERVKQDMPRFAKYKADVVAHRAVQAETVSAEGLGLVEILKQEFPQMPFTLEMAVSAVCPKTGMTEQSMMNRVDMLVQVGWMKEITIDGVKLYKVNV
jgi:hypothetical protein